MASNQTKSTIDQLLGNPKGKIKPNSHGVYKNRVEIVKNCMSDKLIEHCQPGCNKCQLRLLKKY